MLELIDPKDIDIKTDKLKISMFQTEVNGDILHCFTNQDNKMINGSIFLAFSKNAELIIHPMSEEFLKMSGFDHLENEKFIYVKNEYNRRYTGQSFLKSRDVPKFHKRTQYINSLSIGKRYDVAHSNIKQEDRSNNLSLLQNKEIVLCIKEIAPFHLMVCMYRQRSFRPAYAIHYCNGENGKWLELKVFVIGIDLLNFKISNTTRLKVRKIEKEVELVD